MGPMVLVSELKLCASPCSVPNTDGCGVQLLTKIVCAGRANVLPVTCTSSTPAKATHMAGPSLACGGADTLGTRLKNGAIK